VSARAVCDGCGWRGAPTSPAVAAQSARRHTCAPHQARAAAAARRAAALAADGPRADCAHPRAAHAHGTYAAYVLDRCRCRACRDAHLDYRRARARAQTYGTWGGLVPAAPVRAHLAALAAAGIAPTAAARRAGVGADAAVDAARGRRARVRASTAAALLAVPAVPAGEDLVPATGTRRRLEALAARGWSQARLAAETGLSAHGLVLVLGAAAPRVRARTAAAVAAAYDRLWAAAPPAGTPQARAAASRARDLAAARGWAPPLAWDDTDLDDPAARPHGIRQDAA